MMGMGVSLRGNVSVATCTVSVTLIFVLCVVRKGNAFVIYPVVRSSRWDGLYHLSQ